MSWILILIVRYSLLAYSVIKSHSLPQKWPQNISLKSNLALSDHHCWVEKQETSVFLDKISKFFSKKKYKNAIWFSVTVGRICRISRYLTGNERKKNVRIFQIKLSLLKFFFLWFGRIWKKYVRTVQWNRTDFEIGKAKLEFWTRRNS